MRLSHQIEQFIFQQGHTNVERLADYFGISPARCLEELAAILPYGVQVGLCGDVVAIPVCE